LQLSHNRNIFTLDSQIRTEEEIIEEMMAKRSLKTEPHINPELALSILQNNEDRLITLLETLPANSEKNYSRAVLDSLREEQIIVEEKLRIVKDHISERQGTLRHYESLKSEGTTECPNCKHSWIRGYNPLTVSSTRDVLEQNERERASLQAKADSLSAKIADIYSYFGKYQAFINATNGLPALTPLWDYLNQKERVTEFVNIHGKQILL
jgi:hypothetical protein